MSTPTPRLGLRALLPCVAISVVTVLIYAGSLDSPFVNLDDLNQIVRNSLVVAPAQAGWLDLLLTPAAGYVIPVTVGVNALLWKLGGGTAAAFHWAGLALHLLFCGGLWWAAQRITGDVRRPWRAAALVALFAWHPLMVEPTAWATGLKDLLAANLVLGSGLLFGSVLGQARPTRAALVWAVVLAMLAMLCKPNVALVGLAFCGALFVEHKFGSRPVPVSAVSTAVILVMLGMTTGAVTRSMQHLLIRDAVEAPLLAPLQTLGHQLSHWFWPVNLHPVYRLAQLPPGGDVHTLFGAVAVLAVIAFAVSQRRAPRAFLSLCVAACVYLPVSGVIAFPRRIADSYMYVPVAGVLLALVPAIDAVKARRWQLPVVGVLLAALACQSWQQSQRWSSSLGLWSPVSDAYPAWPRPRLGLAGAFAEAGNYSAAVEQYSAAFARGYSAASVGDFGAALAQAGRWDDAECVLAEAALGEKDREFSALRNYVVLATSVRRPLRHRAAASFLLPAALGVPLGLSPASLVRLQGAVADLPQLTAVPPPWPQASCDLLRPSPEWL
ncbi:MAG: hypothetical protein HRU17_00455 [Polyangiaceae bacterium]|nr:hypothetical protein [Polyangiaceae bacterium]